MIGLAAALVILLLASPTSNPGTVLGAVSMMPTPWKELATPDEDAEYLVMASFLPLKRFGATFRFFRFVQAIRRQLATADGLIGYSLWAKPAGKRYWTLSVWRDEAALRTFTHAEPHATIMGALRPDMAPTKFVRWTVDGSGTRIPWDEALQRLEHTPAGPAG